MESTTSSPAKAHPLFQSIDIQTLFAVRWLTAWVLERERAKRSGEAPLAASSTLKHQLQCLPAGRLFRGIQRHRLETVLQSDSAVSELLPHLQGDLHSAARSEMMAALALASLTREMAALFAEAGIPLLVIKGVPLAVQTTGSLTARGRGDCDLFVEPSQVGAAIALLQSAGFALSSGPSCVGDDSPRGRYSRFVSIEISLQRHAGGRWQGLDLHWHATDSRGVMSNFQALWERAEVLYINDQPVLTLSRSDAFLHSCCHAMTDRWRALRNLVDIERLGRSLPSAERVQLSRLRPVRKSLLAIIDAFEEPGVSRRIGRAHAVCLKAQAAQLQPWHCLDDENWTVLYGLQYSAHQINLSHHPVHVFSRLLHQVVPPADLVEPQTGELRPIWQVMLCRAQKLQHRLRAATESPDRRA